MGPKNIVLNDSPLLREALRESFFPEEGFSLLVAEEPGRILTLVEEEDPLMVILDLQVEGAAESSRQIKSDPILAETPILLIGTPGKEDDGAGELFLAPPFQPVDLQEAACRLLNIEKRALKRLPVSFPLHFRNQGKSDVHSAFAVDLSAKGIFIKTEDLYPVGSRLLLELEPGEFSISLEGRVAWVNHPEWIKKKCLPAGLGVEFQSLTLEYQRLFDRLLKERENEFGCERRSSAG